MQLNLRHIGRFRDVLSSMTVALGTGSSKFSAALNSEGNISVSGTVKGGAPHLTSVGNFDVSLVIQVGLLHLRSSSLLLLLLLWAGNAGLRQRQL